MDFQCFLKGAPACTTMSVVQLHDAWSAASRYMARQDCALGARAAAQCALIASGVTKLSAILRSKDAS
jgi:hypothetical protein